MDDFLFFRMVCFWSRLVSRRNFLFIYYKGCEGYCFLGRIRVVFRLIIVYYGMGGFGMLFIFVGLFIFFVFLFWY